jgi:adenylate kinase family enzyme
MTEIIWLMGAPGSGKGTNTPFILEARYLFTHAHAHAHAPAPRTRTKPSAIFSQCAEVVVVTITTMSAG